jgi:hypothetical protein
MSRYDFPGVQRDRFTYTHPCTPHSAQGCLLCLPWLCLSIYPSAMGPKNDLANEIAMIAFRHMNSGGRTQPVAAPVVEPEKKKKHKSKKHKKKNKDCDGQTLSGTFREKNWGAYLDPESRLFNDCSKWSFMYLMQVQWISITPKTTWTCFVLRRVTWCLICFTALGM